MTDYLQEVTIHGRMPALMEQEEIYLPDFKLDRIVDACRPESLKARDFNILVKHYMAKKEPSYKSKIQAQLAIWEANHELLKPYLEASDKLKDIEQMSIDLSEVSRRLNTYLDGENINQEAIQALITQLELGENGVVLAVVDAFRELLQASEAMDES